MIDEQTRGINPYAQHNLARVLKCGDESDTIPSWFKDSLESEYRALRMRLNDLARMLGRNPKRCEHCGTEIK